MRITDAGLTFWLAFMAFLTSLSAAGVMSDVLGAKGASLLLAIVGGLQASTAVLNARLHPIDTARTEGHAEGHAEGQLAGMRRRR